MEVYNLTSLRECNHDLALTGRSLKTQYQKSSSNPAEVEPVRKKSPVLKY